MIKDAFYFIDNDVKNQGIFFVLNYRNVIEIYEWERLSPELKNI